MAKGRAGVQGLSRLRRLLRRLPDDAKAEIRETLQTLGGLILREELARVSRDTGKGAAEIRMVTSRDGLSVKIGIIGKRSWKKAFHLLFLETGTTRMPARPWLWPAAEAVRNRVVPAMTAAVNRALTKAAKRS